MSLPRIIGVTGYAKAGKDTTAAWLVKNLGYNRIALADRMKEALATLNPIVKQYNFPKHPTKLATIVALQGWDIAKADPEVRSLLQRFGTEVGRNMFGEDFWIEQLARATKGFYGTERKLVISDVRFINESRFVRRVGGEVWKVTRVNEDGTPFDNGVGVSHQSEREIGAIMADKHFVADTVEDLEAQLFEYVIERRAEVAADA